MPNGIVVSRTSNGGPYVNRFPLLLALAGLLLLGCSSGGALTETSQPMTVKASISTSESADNPPAVDSLNTITLEFSEALDIDTVAGAVRLYRVRSTGDLIEEPCNLVVDRNVLKNVVIHTADGRKLTEGEEYKLSVNSSIRSISGLSLAHDFAGYFATDYSFALGPGGIADLDSRTAIVCISDIHLGDARSISNGYGWMNVNRYALVQFLSEIRLTPFVKELVVAGDMFDEWVAPMDVDPLNGLAEPEFADSIAAANAAIIYALNDIIRDGRIKVTYVPGNHDMLVTSADIQRILPGISEARDTNAKGLGSYSPIGRSEIIIEHGHRYDFYNAPDPISNRSITGTNSILPPGFFVTKIASTSDLEKTSFVPGMEQIRDNPSNESQHYYFLYWAAWKIIMSQKPVKESWNDKIIKTGIDGYVAPYAINDLIPYYAGGNGPLDVNLYKGIQDTWYDRQTANNVAVSIPTAAAIAAGALYPVLDAQSEVQYFSNDASDKRIVVFGHTHKTSMMPFHNHANQKAVYANTGTWIDESPDNSHPRRTFAVIIPPKADGSTTEYISTYQYSPTGDITRLAHEVITNPGQ